MHVGRRPSCLPYENDRVRRRGGLQSVLAYAIVALLAIGGVILLGGLGMEPVYDDDLALFGP